MLSRSFEAHVLLRRLALALLITTSLAARAQDGAVATAPASVAAPAFPQATLIVHAPAGKQPTTSAIVDDGRTLLVTNRGDNTVTVFTIDGMTQLKTIAEVGYSAWGVVPRTGDQILVANWAGPSIAILDRKSGKRLGEVPCGMKPSYLALSADGKIVYSSGNFSDDVTFVDVPAKKTLKTIPVGHRPMGVALSKDGASLWVAVCGESKVSRIDVATAKVAQSFDAPLATTTNLVLTPDGARLLAAGEAGRLLVIDPGTGTVNAVQCGGDSSSVAVTPDGRVALVTDYTGASVALVDLAAMQRVAVVPVGEGAIDVQTDGRRFFTCNDKSSSVSEYRLDPPALP